MTQQLSALVAAAAEVTGKPLPEKVHTAIAGVKFGDLHRSLVASLAEEGESAIFLGLQANRDAAWADLRALAGVLAQMTGASLGTLSEGANSAGASLAGVLPHRVAGGADRSKTGLNTVQMLQEPRSAYLLANLEPWADLVVAGAMEAFKAADSVVALAAYAGSDLLECADVLLPVGTVAETSGTFVNVEGRWQSFAGAARPLGESRPAWKVLRVLGNLLGLEGFDYDSSEQIRDELHGTLGAGEASSSYAGGHFPITAAEDHAVEVAMYAVDGMVRRSLPLQQTGEGRAEQSAARDSAVAG